MSSPADQPRRRHVTLRGAQLQVVEAGDPQAPPFLFLHGWPESWPAWTQVMSNQPTRRTDADAAWTAAHLTLDPHDEEHKEIRALITDQVVERMEEEIAEWRQERTSGSSR